MRDLARVVPVVQHAAAEYLYGASPIHAITQAALGGYLVGRGHDPRQAIARAEQVEAMGLVPGFEPAALDALEEAIMARGQVFGAGPAPWGAVPFVVSPLFAPGGWI